MGMIVRHIVDIVITYLFNIKSKDIAILFFFMFSIFLELIHIFSNNTMQIVGLHAAY